MYVLFVCILRCVSEFSRTVGNEGASHSPLYSNAVYVAVLYILLY